MHTVTHTFLSPVDFNNKTETRNSTDAIIHLRFTAVHDAHDTDKQQCMKLFS